jgi:uncharacterized membrane protein YqiK
MESVIFIIKLFASAFTVFSVYWLIGFTTIKENENGIVVTLGRPGRMVTSGLIHLWWGFQKIRRFTTTLIELEIGETVIITKKDEFEGTNYGSARITTKSAFYFEWPDTEAALISAIKIVGNPEDKESLKDLFEEPIRDAQRAIGGSKTWKEITQSQKTFAQQITTELCNEPNDPINQAHLKNPKLVITEVELPSGLADAITKPEIARLTRDATEVTAEGEKTKRTKEGEGNASARKALFEAIGNEPENIRKEVLLTLREMAQGTSNTILFQIPSQITDTLSEIFGNMPIEKNFNFRDFFSRLSESQKADLLKIVETMTATGGKI